VDVIYGKNTWPAVWCARSVGHLSQLLGLQGTLQTLNFTNDTVAFKLRQHLLLHCSLVLGLQCTQRRLVAGVVVTQPSKVGNEAILLLNDALVVHPMIVALLLQTYISVRCLSTKKCIIQTF